MIPASGLILWFLRRFGFVGVTLYPIGIYVLPEMLEDRRLHKHEMAHWRQAQRMGAVRFYVTYLWYSIRFGYRNNPLEIEAREQERQ